MVAIILDLSMTFWTLSSKLRKWDLHCTFRTLRNLLQVFKTAFYLYNTRVDKQLIQLTPDKRTILSAYFYIIISVSWSASDFEIPSFLLRLVFGFCVFLCGADQTDSLSEILPVWQVWQTRNFKPMTIYPISCITRIAYREWRSNLPRGRKPICVKKNESCVFSGSARGWERIRFQDFISNSPYCPPYSYFDVSFENLVSDHLIL